MNKVDHVAVWPDEIAARERGVRAFYSVSVCEADGDEIRCVGGSTSKAKAWDLGREHASDLDVELLMLDGQGAIVDRATFARPVGPDGEALEG